LTPPQQDEDPLINSTQTSPSYDSDDDDDNDIFSYAAHVLATEAAALASITTLYRTSAIAKQNLKAAVKTIVQTQHDRGKLIVTGVGKSAYIGQKLVATCKSMGVAASFMHACEAAHGDLGDIRDVGY
jgi:D-arabinose 5-phosphate isomerase GutQ